MPRPMLCPNARLRPASLRITTSLQNIVSIEIVVREFESTRRTAEREQGGRRTEGRNPRPTAPRSVGRRRPWGRSDTGASAFHLEEKRSGAHFDQGSAEDLGLGLCRNPLHETYCGLRGLELEDRRGQASQLGVGLLPGQCTAPSASGPGQPRAFQQVEHSHHSAEIRA